MKAPHFINFTTSTAVKILTRMDMISSISSFSLIYTASSFLLFLLTFLCSALILFVQTLPCLNT
nr:MAG TPA: Thrombin inhibitor from mosquito [Caudoviricetes sp.]